MATTVAKEKGGQPAFPPLVHLEMLAQQRLSSPWGIDRATERPSAHQHQPAWYFALQEVVSGAALCEHTTVREGHFPGGYDESDRCNWTRGKKVWSRQKAPPTKQACGQEPRPYSSTPDLRRAEIRCGLAT